MLPLSSAHLALGSPQGPKRRYGTVVPYLRKPSPSAQTKMQHLAAEG